MTYSIPAFPSRFLARAAYVLLFIVGAALLLVLAVAAAPAAMMWAIVAGN